jgi:hypothetical protein
MKRVLFAVVLLVVLAGVFANSLSPVVYDTTPTYSHYSDTAMQIEPTLAPDPVELGLIAPATHRSKVAMDYRECRYFAYGSDCWFDTLVDDKPSGKSTHRDPDVMLGLDTP